MFDSRFPSLTFQALSISHRAGKEEGESCGANEKFRTVRFVFWELREQTDYLQVLGKQLIARSPLFSLLIFTSYVEVR